MFRRARTEIYNDCAKWGVLKAQYPDLQRNQDQQRAQVRSKIGQAERVADRCFDRFQARRGINPRIMMPLRLPPLASLRLFESAGRHQSFKLAAAELHLTPSAVSHGIASLENWLGVPLFERRPNAVVLTREGRDYLPFVSDALATIAVGTRRLPHTSGVRRVSISVAPTFAARWLLPRMGAFLALHKDISVTIDTSHRQLGLPVEDVDLVIRMARAPWPDLPSTCLLAQRLVPVCSPDFLKSHQCTGTLDLTSVSLIHVASATEDWAAWLDQAGVKGIDLTRGLFFDTVHMAMDAAAAGLGVAIGRLPLVQQDLTAGRILQAAEVTVTGTTGYWLIEATRSAPRDEAREFAEWLKRQAVEGE